MLKNSKYVYGPPQPYVPGHVHFGEFMLQRLHNYKDRVALINAVTKEQLTYGDIAQQSMNLALSLSNMGVGPGHVVGISSENRLEFWGALVGILCAGATFTPFNTVYTSGELEHALNISKPSHIICSPAMFKRYEKNFKSHSFVKKLIVFGDETFSGTILYKDLVVPNDRNKVLKRNINIEEFQVKAVKGQVDTAFILYSSGTTGLSKGVMLTHLNTILACSRPIVDEDDTSNVSLTVTPWFHVMGVMVTLVTISMGRKIVFLPKFEVDLYLKTIEEYKITNTVVVPPILVALSKSTSKYDLSSMRALHSGAAPLYKETLADVLKMFSNLKTVHQGYGMTEASIAVISDGGEGVVSKPGGVGFAVPGVTVKVTDLATGQPLGPNQPGEICVKGSIIMKGYISKDRKEDFDDEDFFRTGDVGYYDDDCYFFIVDRLKELIKYKAYQVPPAEIEAILLQHECVRDAAVVGIPHEVGGEVPLAFVVKQPGRTVTEQEVKDLVAERLSNHKQLRGGVRFVDQIPKNPSGKILRRVLKEMVKSEKSKL